MALKPGEISPPIQTQFGWHVARLNEVREKPRPTIEEMRDQLVDQIRQTVIDAAIEDMVAQAEVTRADTADIDPASLSDDTLLAE